MREQIVVDGLHKLRNPMDKAFLFQIENFLKNVDSQCKIEMFFLQNA